MWVSVPEGCLLVLGDGPGTAQDEPEEASGHEDAAKGLGGSQGVLDEQVYGMGNALAERICADIDFDIFQVIEAAIPGEKPWVGDKGTYDAEVEKRVKAKMGCQGGRMAVWDEELD